MKAFKFISLSIVSLLMASAINAQSSQPDSLSSKELWNRAESYVMVNMFDEALTYYMQLYEKDTTNKHIAFKIGYCYLQDETNQDVNNALDFLLLASTGISKQFHNKISETNAPVETNYFLGVAYRLQKDYKTALDYYRDFQKDFSYAKMNIINQGQLDLEIRTCNEATNDVKYSDMVPYKFKMRNTIADLYIRCPIFAEEAGVLFFTLGKNTIFPPDINYDRDYDAAPLDSIYFSRRLNDSIWDEPVNLSRQMQVTSPILPVSTTPDAKKVFFIIDVGDNGDIYMSEFADNKISIPVSLKGDVNTRHWESFASVTSDGKRIYFTSLRPGGIGNMDIYYSDLDENDKWGTAVNLGTGINTIGYEEMPYISRNGSELYFSSEGHTSTGGFDLFYTNYSQRDNIWTKPANLGFPFNTDGNDMGYVVEFEGDVSFCPINSSRRRFGYEECDCISLKREKIYRPVAIKCVVTPDNTLTELPEDIMLYVINKENNDTVYSFKAKDTNGSVNFTLPAGDYSLTTISEWTEPSTKNLNVPLNSGNISMIVPVSAGSTANNPYKNIATPLTGAPVTCNVVRDNSLSAMPSDLKLYVFNETTKQMIQSYNITDSKNSITLQLPAGEYTFKAESSTANPAMEKLIVPENNRPLSITLTISAPSDKFLTITWVQFDFDMYNIKPEFYANLDSLANYLKKYPQAVVAVHGHTDPFGTNEYNIALGQRRYTSVKNYLINKGVSASQLPTETYGEEKRVAKGETAQARKYDRRVEFYVHKQGGITLKVNPLLPPKELSID